VTSPRSLKGWVQPVAGRGVYLGGDWTAIKAAELEWLLYYRGEPVKGEFRSLTMIQEHVSRTLKELHAAVQRLKT
jgi:hypothetical protein